MVTNSTDKSVLGPTAKHSHGTGITKARGIDNINKTVIRISLFCYLMFLEMRQVVFNSQFEYSTIQPYADMKSFSAQAKKDKC